jgi:hypothetical protein
MPPWLATSRPDSRRAKKYNGARLDRRAPAARSLSPSKHATSRDRSRVKAGIDIWRLEIM